MQTQNQYDAGHKTGHGGPDLARGSPVWQPCSHSPNGSPVLSEGTRTRQGDGRVLRERQRCRKKHVKQWKRKNTSLTNVLIVMHMTAMNLYKHVNGLCPAIKHNEQFMKKTLIPFRMFLAAW